MAQIRYQNNHVLIPFVFSTLVNSGHQITEFYYINFFGHKLTNFNAPQKPTFLEKKVSLNFNVYNQKDPITPEAGEKKAPLLSKILKRGNLLQKVKNHCTIDHIWLYMVVTQMRIGSGVNQDPHWLYLFINVGFGFILIKWDIYKERAWHCKVCIKLISC